jgi:undecaprenyl-diphosphatase
VSAYLAVRFLARFFQRGSVRPFAIYCLLAGSLAIVRFWSGAGFS